MIFFDFFRLFGPAKSADESWGERISKSHLPLFFLVSTIYPTLSHSRASSYKLPRNGDGFVSVEEFALMGLLQTKVHKETWLSQAKICFFTAGDVDICNATATGSWLMLVVFHSVDFP